MGFTPLDAHFTFGPLSNAYTGATAFVQQSFSFPCSASISVIEFSARQDGTLFLSVWRRTSDSGTLTLIRKIQLTAKQGINVSDFCVQMY